jgi:hypothetical protein
MPWQVSRGRRDKGLRIFSGAGSKNAVSDPVDAPVSLGIHLHQASKLRHQLSSFFPLKRSMALVSLNHAVFGRPKTKFLQGLLQRPHLHLHIVHT